MSDKRIIEYDAATAARTDDNILMDSPAVGTRKITATNLIKPAMDALASEQTARENADTNILNTLRGEIAEVDDKSIASGGTTGQVLFKHSNTDYDTEWDDLIIPSSASDISYNNTTSGLSATNVQTAIDENAADITEIKSNLTHLTSSCTSANNNVTIGSINTVARSVDVVQVSLVFTTASQIATNTNIIKMPYKALCDSVIPIRADSGTLFLLALTAGSEYISVYGTAALGAGNFRGSFTYICQ